MVKKNYLQEFDRLAIYRLQSSIELSSMQLRTNPVGCRVENSKTLDY